MAITISRRHALMGGALGAAALLRPVTSAAQTAAPVTTGPRPTVYDRPVGDLRVSVLLDGYLDLGKPLVTNIADDAYAASLQAAFQDPAAPIRLPISAHLVQGPDGITLIDAGSGAAFGPTAGRLTAALDPLGLSPADITRVVLTHMHPDHIGGLVAADGSAVFANAALHVNTPELAFWTDEAIAAGVPADAQPFFALARTVATAYAERVTPFTGEADLGGGLSIVQTPGHTPGHCAVRVSSGDAQLLIWGDAAAIAALQFTHPDSGIAFDADGAMAAQTRRRLLDMASTDRIAVAGTHLPFPGVGHVARRDAEFAWVPETWVIS
jgi:glyoxylase-like metal-dependent hydrolase (beta-lactamase superfamily II)